MKNNHNSLFLISLILLVLSGSALVVYASISDPIFTAVLKDGVDGFDELSGIVETATIVIDGITYALVTAESDGALTIINISNPASPIEIAVVQNNVNGFDELGEIFGVTTVVIGATPYALVASFDDSSLTIIDISTPATPVETAVVIDNAGGFDELAGASGVTTVVIGATTYALVTASGDASLTIIDISTPATPVETSFVTDNAGGFDELAGIIFVDTVVIGATTYALVTSQTDDSLTIIDISTPATPVETAVVQDGVGGFDELNGAYGITTVVIDSTTYALVTTRLDDSLTIIDISTPATPVETAFVKDNVGGFDAGDLNDALQVKTVVIDGITYALVATSNTLTADGLTIIDISTPASPVKITKVTDSEILGSPVSEFTELNGAFGVTIVVIDSITYALVTSVTDNSLTIIDISSVSSTTSTTGGGDSKHKTRPTFGLDHKTFFQLIEGGFSFNDVPHDITHNFWTPFEQQKIKVGELNSFETKVYASEKLRVQEFLFGIPVVGEAQKAELGVEIFYDYSGEIEEIRVIQKTDIIDINSIQIEKIKSKCRADSSDELCVTTQLQMKFLEPLKDSVMAIKAIDFKGRSQITYLNDGFDISGDSLNPMKTMMIIGTEKYEGLIKVTQIAKYSDVWVAENGRAFELNEYGSSKLIYQTVEDKLETSKNFDRYHLEFYKLFNFENKKAQLVLDKLCIDCSDVHFDKINNIFSYEYPEEITRDADITFQLIIDYEKQKAEATLLELLKLQYPTSYQYMIDSDDRPISVILAEERTMKKILADERAYLKQVIVPQQ